MNLLPIVKHIGLTDKEARVYLACLEVGSGPVSHIATHARMNRVTAYDVLEKLMKKGMVHSMTKSKIRFFDAVDPDIVAGEFSKRAANFKKSLPFFKKLRGEGTHPRIRYFEGIEGIKALYADTLKSKTEILNYSNSKEIRDHWNNYDEEYVSERAKQKIFLRGISPKDEHGAWVHARDKENFREIRLVPPKEFTFTNEINIYDDKMAIASFKDEPLIGMIIESMEIANTQRDIFKMAWQFAGRLKPKGVRYNIF